MAWYNPLSWGQNDPEKYDPNSENAKAARTFGGPRHDYDVQGVQAQGSQLDQTQANQSRAQQQNLAGTLEQQMRGQGPSAADAAAQGQQRAALANAAALNAGSRGRSSVGNAIAGNAIASQGVQQAAQNQFVNKQQEMAQARGEYGNLSNNMRAQDLGAAGQNAQLAQNAAQYNAANQQQATLANQAAALGISQQEMAARLHQGDMEFSNLDPGSKGYFSDVMAALPEFATPFAHGGVVGRGLPHYGGGMAIGGTSPSYELMGIGQRRVPISKGDLDQGRELAKGIINFVGSAKAAGGRTMNAMQAMGKDMNPMSSGGGPIGGQPASPVGTQGTSTGPGAEAVGSQSSAVTSSPDAAESAGPALGSTSAPVTAAPLATGGGSSAAIPAPVAVDPSGVDALGGMLMADGGVVGSLGGLVAKLAPLAMMFLRNGGAVSGGPDPRRGPVQGPQKALIGEAGPEAVVEVRGIVDRPTVTTLGANGRTQAVVPLSRGHEGDRRRVIEDIVRLCNGGAMGGRSR